MLLLENKGKQEDQDRIFNMNNLSVVEQRKILLRIAKEEGWDIHFTIIKKKQKDWKNFHILAGKVMIQRAEYWKNKRHPWMQKVIRWSLVKQGEQKRISGDYGTIINMFCDEVKK